MTVTDVRKDLTARTMTITAEFDATVEQVWRMWADPRLLERWWGPPTYPATVVEHDLTPGSRVAYFMTSPEGDRYHGYWSITSVDAPKTLTFDDGFADADGHPNDDMPTTSAEVRIEEHGTGRTRMTIRSTFPTIEAMEQLLTMGMEEGIVSAIGQIDDILVSA
jgi:uncharacterized protein YndB with AHSA1/START domain